tara:strand:+ start:846 stop:1781 length:936 start_codon:yes stop_codon:yes gene_type:complete
MADIKNSFNTPNLRESMDNEIYFVDQLKTPVVSSISKGKAVAKLEEWNVDAISDAKDNAIAENADFGTADMQPADRIGNRLQTAERVVKVSDLSRELNTAGYEDELDQQIMKETKALKTDIEFGVCKSGAQVVGNGTSVSARSAGIETFISTNTDSGVGAVEAAGNGTDVRTAGTLRSFAESQITAVMATAYENGATPSMMILSPTKKVQASGFLGLAVATRNTDAMTKTAYNAVDVYVSDFGQLDIVPSTYSNTATALILDTSNLELLTIRDFKEIAKGKDSHTETVSIVTDYTLKVNNEKSCAAIHDLS